MNQRALWLLGLFLVAGLTTWLLRYLTAERGGPDAGAFHDPDYYMEDFSTLTMEEDGRPKHRLRAVYMAHYPADDTTELLRPGMEIYRIGRLPLFISAERGWVTDDNNVVILRGAVRLWEDDAAGRRVLQVDTTEARVLLDSEYAETDRPAVIVSGSSTISGTGMRAYLKESRLEVRKHERTTIAPGPNS
ncbi:MAG: LPS export ABC transporter periplasmic protein LptC [Gammaproteobacteria bacterium]|nr:LPS export ABC transporter periplasmic protein LptC [Gammaproteobacteria bacterium]